MNTLTRQVDTALSLTRPGKSADTSTSSTEPTHVHSLHETEQLIK